MVVVRWVLMSIRALLIGCGLLVAAHVRADGETPKPSIPMSKPEADVRPPLAEARLGLYTAVFTDNDSGDRAAGRGGSGQRVRATLELRRVGDQVEAIYAVAREGKPPAATATLSGVQLTSDTFRAAPIAIKSPWPLYLPAHFEGRFLSADSLLLDGKRYERAASKTPTRR